MLIALGTGVAYVFSLFALLFSHALPAAFSAHGSMPPIYFEAAAVITALVLLGQVLERFGRSKTDDYSAIESRRAVVRRVLASISPRRRPRAWRQ